MDERNQDFRNGVMEARGEVSATLKAIHEMMVEVKENQGKMWEEIHGLREDVTEQFRVFRVEEIAPLNEKVGTLQAFKWKIIGLAGGISFLIAVGGIVAKVYF